jgi:hypothetical protein
MRLRMTRIPKGADLILNKVSGAPGFCIGNVIVLAGVPYAPAMHGSSRRPNVWSRRCWSECGEHNLRIAAQFELRDQRVSGPPLLTMASSAPYWQKRCGLHGKIS